MTTLLKTQKKIEKHEMLSSNAASLFLSRRQFHLAEKLKCKEGLIQLCKIADFVDPCPYPFALSIPNLLYIKLFDTQTFSINGIEITRILGALACEKNALKIFLKENPSPALSHHLFFLEDKKLFSQTQEGFWMWLPKAETIRQVLLNRWNQILSQNKFKLCTSPSCIPSKDHENNLLHHHQQCFLSLGYDKLAEILYLPCENSEPLEGLLNTKAAFTDRLSLFFSNENFLENCISSLHFILEMPKILGFEYQITLGCSSEKGYRSKRNPVDAYSVFRAALEKTGLNYKVEKERENKNETRIEIKLFDAMGRLWNGPFMAVPANTKVPVLICSIFGTIERLIGLMLEHYAGRFPLWLAPEQVRLFPISDKARVYANHIHHLLKKEGIRSEVDIEKTDLGLRLYRANREGVPLAVISGDRELEDLNVQTLLVKTLESKQEERMSINALCERIKNSECGVSSESEN